METKKHLPTRVLHGKWSRAGSPSSGWPPSSVLSLLLLLLLSLSPQRAAAWDKQYTYKVGTTGTENKTSAININGNLYYQFDLYFFNFDGSNYYWSEDTYLAVDGQKLCTFKDLLSGKYDKWGTSDEDAAKSFVENYNHTVVTKQYNISGVTNVYVSVINPWKVSDKGYALTVNVTFERNFSDKQWKIGIYGSWHDKNSGWHEATENTIFTTSKPTVTMPDFPATKFSRGNKTVSFTYPSTNISYGTAGWNNQVVMYKSDCTNKYMNPSGNAWGTYTDGGSFAVDDNYNPVYVYPRFEYTKTGATVSNPSHTSYGTNTVTFDKDYKVVLPGYPRPAGIKYENYNAFTRKVTITWSSEIADESNVSKDGKWYIFRKVTSDASTQIKLGEVAYTTTTYTDTKADQPYGSTYTYTVCYVPNGWTVNSEANAEGLSGYVSKTFNRDFSFGKPTTSDTVINNKTNIVFSWSHDALVNADGSHPYTLYVQRSDDEGKTWADKQTISITSSKTTEGTYYDADVQSHKLYKYRVKMRVQGEDETSSVVDYTVTDGSKIVDKSFTATRGSYSNVVKLSWEVNQVGTNPTYFILQRRPFGSNSEDDWSKIYNTSGTASTYSYDDNTAQSGSFNEYRLRIFDEYNGQRYEGTSQTTDGFCLATGVVSGRITYGSGTAVKGAKVTLNATNGSGNAVQGNKAIYLDGQPSSGLVCNTTVAEDQKLFGGDFSIQMWVNPSSAGMPTKDTPYTLFDMRKTLGISVIPQGNGMCKVSFTGNNGSLSWTPLEIPMDKWSHIAFVYNRQKDVHKKKLNAYVIEVSGRFKGAQGYEQDITLNTDGKPTNFSLGNFQSYSSGNRFVGYIDEFRFFNKALTDEEMWQNFNHTLNGSEEGLQVYYPFDEGLLSQKIAYDFSKTNGVANGHHATAKVAAKGQGDNVPSSEQLSLMTYTDQNGNYMLRGVPFSGEGTSYTITPTLGVHQFNPGNESRFFSQNSLTYSGVNFEDVSSFPVSGMVYYEGTTIPVEDASLYVDGMLASKDGAAVTTNALGEFTVDVPIGDHFISVKKNGHTFVDGGRFPRDDDGVGRRETFESARSNLTFFDNTRVIVAGRVAGGDLEYEKPLGVLQGVANIGKAIIKLAYDGADNTKLNATWTQSGTAYSVSSSTSQRDYDPTNKERINSQAYVAVVDNRTENEVTIVTDSVTGEWAAQLLPLRYTVKSVIIPKNTDGITFQSLPTIDASNPLVYYTDSTELENGDTLRFKYNASAKIEYKAKSTIDVTEHDDGSFGLKSYTVKDINGKEHKVDLYTVDDKGRVTYTYDYPVYEELGTYIYDIHAYEQYENRDGSEVVYSTVPLSGKEVTIRNQYASTTSVVATDETGGYKPGDVYEIEDDTFQLDSLGHATYQFVAGLPNLQEPFTRGITVTYENGGQQEWSQNDTFKVIVLGALPTGNNFVTQGPDEILMILRDPAGTGSSATWSKGSSVSTTKGRTVNVNEGLGTNETVFAGVDTKTSQGVGFAVITEVKSKVNIGIEAEVTNSFANMKNKTTTVTTTQDISTSDASDYVGAKGDVFIGTAKNLIFGACHQVFLKWNNTTGQAELVKEETLSTGEEFTTGFKYTQNYVEGVLLPNFEALRNALLQPVANTSNVDQPAAGSDPIYVTTLSKDDKNYGTSNNDTVVWGDKAKDFSTMKNGRFEGESYTMILPEDYKQHSYQDMVQFYNMQIEHWKHQLYLNEKAKVEAIENREKWLEENHSFDAGSIITSSVTNDTIHSRINTEEQVVNAILSQDFGNLWDGVGLNVHIEERLGLVVTEEQQRDETETQTISYTLHEEGSDYLSIDVLEAPDGFGPIFYTIAGATSCPYEDEVVTEYYQPGTVIAQKTVQIEKPEIEAETQAVTGIPAGGKGTFVVNLRNNSSTKDEIWYNLNVDEKSNPHGLQVFVDGLNITNGRTILVAADSTLKKTFTVEQSKPDVLTYENIKIRMSSVCQPDNTGIFPEIADTTTVSFFFQPTCSDIKLASTHTLVNTDTDTPVTFSMSGYNYSMASLEGIRLEFKRSADADFHTLQEYTKNEAKLESNPNLKLLRPLNGTDKLNFTIDLRESTFADDTYTFRAVTVCNQGGTPVTNESEEIVVVRDMSRPQLIATPSPASGILGNGDDLTLTFNEDIQGGILSKLNNFTVVGVMNETKVAHDVALSLTGDNAAKTEAPIDLAGKSFATNLWLNYTQDGTLLQHGTADNNFTIAIEDGRLAVSVDNVKTLSDATLPTGKWLYLNVSYDASQKMLTAGYAQDASTVSLINTDEVPAYEGNGPVSVGGTGLTAKVQELALWNSSRSMAEAQAGMYTTKSRFTTGLLGYWQLNEGHGAQATDRARSRNMTLPSENAWWINGDNYALVLDGTKAPAASIATLNTTDSEDYLVEAWVKADEEQNGVASLLSTQAMDLHLNANGQLELALSGSPAETALAATDLRDGQWHHVAVNVLKSTNGAAAIYLDGQQLKTIAASAMPALYGEKLMLGSHRPSVNGDTYDQMLRGAIDEVRIWKGRRTADVIRNNMYNRVAAKADGLVAYYPMERLGLDSYNQVVTTEDLTDATVSGGSAAGAALTLFTEAGAPAIAETINAGTAALTVAPSQENVQFSFVASERQIKLNLEEEPYKLEGCTVYITAKEVKDARGNMADPITWSVLVQQHQMEWAETEVSVRKENAQSATFDVKVENISGTTANWAITNLPTWLSVNYESGTLAAQTAKTITFTVEASTAVGKYEHTIYVSGDDGVQMPLVVNVVAEGERPKWTVNPADYEFTMNIVGQLKINDKLSEDTEDMVAAFKGTECVGVAHPQYMKRYDAYFVMMTAYSNNEKDDISFKVYDASTGITYPSVNVSNNFSFEKDGIVGTVKSPVIWTPDNKVEQDIALSKGWNWISIYAEPENKAVGSVLKNVSATQMKNSNSYTQYTNNVWTGELSEVALGTMYKLQADKDGELQVIGTPVVSSPVTIRKGWNWVGVSTTATLSPAEAFGSAEPMDGDLVKSQKEFSMYSQNGWVGSLKAIVPGMGYLYSSEDDAVKSFTYPAKGGMQGRRLAPRQVMVSGTEIELLENNMNVIATVVDEYGVERTDAVIRVSTNGELRGEAIAPSYESEYFLTVQGKTGEAEMLISVELDGVTYNVGTVFFQKDALFGSVKQPVVLTVGETTAIGSIDFANGNANGKVYDLGGRRVSSEKLSNGQLNKGVYINDHKKVVK